MNIARADTSGKCNPMSQLQTNERICVLAWQEPGATPRVSRGNKLHLREDTLLMAAELDRDYPEFDHWAAPATEAELVVHATQLARLMAEEVRQSEWDLQFCKKERTDFDQAKACGDLREPV
jgi:hypothetical protein